MPANFHLCRQITIIFVCYISGGGGRGGGGFRGRSFGRGGGGGYGGEFIIYSMVRALVKWGGGLALSPTFQQF